MFRSLCSRPLGHVALIVSLLFATAWWTPAVTAEGPVFQDAGQEVAPQDRASGKARRRPVKKLVKKARAIRNEYIVVLDDEVVGAPGETSQAESLADALVGMYGGKVRQRFKHAINAFTAKMTEAQAAAMSGDAMVAYIEEDAEVSLAAVQSPATWGLDRIDQRPRTLTNTYSYSYMGTGVNVYVVDTGITTGHLDFGGRAFAQAGWDFIRDGRNGQDCHGHGTHVAGTIGGNTVGVAKRATLVSVRVFDCGGQSRAGAILSAVNSITAYHRKPAVVNMSLEAGLDYALDLAVANSVNAGITYVVAAGNNNVDACGVSPARAVGAITVGATNTYDQRAGFDYPGKSSNWGQCVDIWAPGYGIWSAKHTSTTEWAQLSGTSMASPHVAGAAAIYLSYYPSATPAEVRSIILNTATTGLLTGIGSSPNRLLYSLLRP